MNRTRVFALLGLIILGAALRLIPSGVNVAPIGAIAIFCGLTFRNRWLALAIPLAATFTCDLILGLQNGDLGGYLFNRLMLFVYVSWVLYALCGFAVRACYQRTDNLKSSKRRLARSSLLAGGSLTGSLLFFIVTNFGCWVIGTSVYPRSLAGLTECYVAAIPFFRGTLVSDLVCLGGLLAAAAVVRALTAEPTGKTAIVYAD